MIEYENQCGNCINYDFQGDNYKGYCSYYRQYFYPGDSCRHQEKRQSTGSTCYITTIVCNVLGLNDQCDVLNTLRGFRNDIMQINSQYMDTLMEYDVVGPKIASEISKEYNETKSTELWQGIYDYYLVPTSDFIKKKDYNEAIKKYKQMVTSLKDYYCIDGELEKVENYDMSQGGHGIVKKIGSYFDNLNN